MRPRTIEAFGQMTDEAITAYIMADDYYLLNLDGAGVPRYSHEEARAQLLRLVMAVAEYTSALQQEARDQGLL